ncbi:MAG TPA: nickel transporter permease [Acidimicrobiales bacterium]|nr:nickel transporter permease [Acidimicrobiales bacterium]
MTGVQTITPSAGLVVEAAEELPPPKGHLLRGLLRDGTAMAGLVIVVSLALAALFASVLAPHDPDAVDVVRRFAPPSAEFPLGTDHLGRDVLSRLLHGARLSIGATLAVTLGISAIGLVMGMVAGYARGALDTVVSRVIEVLLALPPFLLALAVTGVLGPGLGNLMLAITLVWWASYARIVRGVVLAETGRAYVEAARAVGASGFRVLGRHVLPNILAPIIVLTTLDLGAVLLGLSGLSFLGLGVKPPTAEWGAMLAEGRVYLAPAPNMMLFPGAAIFLMVLGFNLLGDGLRDLLDPRTRIYVARRGRGRQEGGGAPGRSSA